MRTTRDNGHRKYRKYVKVYKQMNRVRTKRADHNGHFHNAGTQQPGSVQAGEELCIT